MKKLLGGGGGAASAKGRGLPPPCPPWESMVQISAYYNLRCFNARI